MASLNILIHNVTNLLYDEHWTDKRKYCYVILAGLPLTELKISAIRLIEWNTMLVVLYSLHKLLYSPAGKTKQHLVDELLYVSNS